MNRLLVILILTFSLQTLSKAEDISNFQIEGMSIGDSLLDYMDENTIIKEMNKGFSYFYNDDFVAMSTWIIRDKFKIYNDVGVILKVNDNKYKIYALEGVLYMNEDSHIEECYKKQNEIVNDIKNSLNLNSQGNTWFVSKERLKKHQLSIKYIDFELSEGGVIRTICYEIKKGVKKHSDLNLLNIVVNSPIFWKYLYKQD